MEPVLPTDSGIHWGVLGYVPMNKGGQLYKDPHFTCEGIYLNFGKTELLKHLGRNNTIANGAFTPFMHYTLSRCFTCENLLIFLLREKNMSCLPPLLVGVDFLGHHWSKHFLRPPREDAI